MKTLESITTSLEVSKKLDKALKSAGIKVEPLFWWLEYVEYQRNSNKEIYYWGIYRESEGIICNEYRNKVPALTASEIGEILKKYEMECIWFEEKNSWGCYQTCKPECFYSDTEADSRALMLCYLIDSQLLKK